MPGYTTPDCLPYFLCSDDPCLNTGTVCEPSTVFCDFTALLDAKISAIDNIIGRTATAIPLAKVARNSVYTINTNPIGYDARIAWDTVVEDNNDMVDLDLNSKAILVQTPGIYMISSYVIGAPPATVNNIFSIYIGTSTGSILTQADTLWLGGTNPETVAHEELITAPNIAGFGGAFPLSTLADFQGTTGTGIVTVNYAEMTVYWVADVP